MNKSAPSTQLVSRQLKYKFLIPLGILVSLLIFHNKSYSQAMSLDLNPAYYGIYNISYFGGQDGYIDLTVTGGTPPYTYAWSYNHETNEDIWDLIYIAEYVKYGI